MGTQDEVGGKKDVRSTAASGTPSDPKQEALPSDFEKKARKRFDAFTEPEVTFAQYLEFEKNEFYRQQDLAINPQRTYTPVIKETMTPCGNGDFNKDDKLKTDEWQGAYGSFLPPDDSADSPGTTINFLNLTEGILAGAINLGAESIVPPLSPAAPPSGQAHQTWVPVGTDPIVGIPTTPPGATGAVRIGNAVTENGCELLSKTFIVPADMSTISFWYAVVLQEPNHFVYEQPFFWVRVTDDLHAIVPGAFSFGGALGDKLIADTANPFFHTQNGTPLNYTPANPAKIVYKDWSCAQIDLSNMIGRQVTIEFVTADCSRTGDWGYAYIGRFCGDRKDNPTGNIEYNAAESTHCGPGKICFDYSLPTTSVGDTDADTVPIFGSVTISLAIYQNGALLYTDLSPELSRGSSYCFDITPALIPGINPALGGFDFVATGAFSIGNTALGHIIVGAPKVGIEPGQNNDYQIACEKTCEEIIQDQNTYLSEHCAHKVNSLPRTDCDRPEHLPDAPRDCHCECVAIQLPDIRPCISVRWGNSPCDCLETDDVEVLCVTVCNCYSNVTFTGLSIGHIQITDMAGNPVPLLPDGTPSVQVIPSGPICFGDIGPCEGKDKPGCVSRELVLYTRGAIGRNYLLSFEGVCFTVCHHLQSKQCFIVPVCQD